jgi:hypothetical protein
MNIWTLEGTLQYLPLLFLPRYKVEQQVSLQLGHKQMAHILISCNMAYLTVLLFLSFQPLSFFIIPPSSLPHLQFTS